MKFFWPDEQPSSEGENAYRALRQTLRSQGYPILYCRLHSIDYMRDGVAHTAMVGSRSTANHETVMAIFATATGWYLICTSSDGTSLTTAPLLAGNIDGDRITEVDHFTV